MTRLFGSKLIEQFLPAVDLRTIIDTSRAHIPGHGTPTVILIGRNRKPSTETVRAVLGVRGEPGTPADAAKGLVWVAISNHIGDPGFENAYISVVDLPRETLRTYPWSLSGGGAVELSELLDQASKRTLKESIRATGFAAITGEDAAYEIPTGEAAKNRLALRSTMLMIDGESVRDYTLSPENQLVWPYQDDLSPLCLPAVERHLWPNKRLLQVRRRFGIPVENISRIAWWEFRELYPDKLRSALSITFPFVATHNHFVLDRGGKVFIRTAPVIKLPEGSSDDDHLRLLGVLNSSVACFWLKQNSFNKGNGGIGGGIGDEEWEPRYEFTGTTLKDFPLPSTVPLEPAKVLDDLAQALQQQSPYDVAARNALSTGELFAARVKYERLRGLMISYQEELDWEYYRIYGLIDDDLAYPGDVPEISLGERAFEIALARRIKDGEETAWFERHRSTPITHIPDHIPAAYQELLQRRLDAIESNPHIRLLERPEYKRRWAEEPWDKQVESALRDWLLDRVEDRALWYDREGRPNTMSTAQLADVLDRDDDFRNVLRLWAGDSNLSTGTALAKLLADEGVPYLSAYRYKPTGLEKRAAWEETWGLQRREDQGEKLASPIPVPPMYKPADFTKTSYWSHRGKLDVPKERFIS